MSNRPTINRLPSTERIAILNRNKKYSVLGIILVAIYFFWPLDILPGSLIDDIIMIIAYIVINRKRLIVGRFDKASHL